MDKIKILFIHHGGSAAGAPRSLYFLISQLDREKYEPHILFWCDETGNRELFGKLNIPLHFEKYMGPWHGSVVSGMTFPIAKQAVKRAIPTYILTLKILKEVKPDIVHLNSTCLWVSAKAVKKYSSTLPVICHVREPLLDGFWGDILRKGCNKYVDEYIAIEKYDAESLGSTDKPINIIYNFVDFATYNSEVRSDCLRTEFNIGKDETIFLYLARIVKQNGALEMLQALSLFLRSNNRVHLCIAGADFNSKDEYFLSVLNVAKKYNNVHILPFRRDVPNVISSSDVMIVPFREPHFARSIIEAGAIGIPTIASNIPGPQELVIDGKTGYLVDCKTLEGLEDKCRLLTNDVVLRKKLGKNAEEYAKENFNAVKNAKKTFEIYEKILGI